MHRIDRLPNGTQTHHIRPAINETTFDGNCITVDANRLTLLVRKDVNFATRSLQMKFMGNTFAREAVAESYAQWGTDVMALYVNHLNVAERYNLPQETSETVDVHFHSADLLASSVIQKASLAETAKPVYVSLDDQIDHAIFERSGVVGSFAEVGFSRLFNVHGEQQGYVGRPGKGDLKDQIKIVADILTKQREERGGQKIPLVLLEDNVRHAKMVLWVIDRMKEGGVFKHGYVSSIATCFSVASEEERKKLQFNGNQLPLHVGYEYKGGAIDSVTTRDHLFDGFVVEYKGQRGRLPSFMMPLRNVESSFKLKAGHAKPFIDGVMDANLCFCEKVENEIGHRLTLKEFTPGPLIASVLNVPVTTPMQTVLDKSTRPGKRVRMLQQKIYVIK